MTTLTRPESGTTRRTSPRPGRAALLLVATWVILLGVIVGWGWLLTHTLRSSVTPWDNGISRWFADQRTGALNTPADVGTLLGETPVGVGVTVVAALAFAAWRRTWWPLLFAVLLEAGIGGFYYFATTVDERQRPPVKILDPGLVPDHSFPSGHVATAVVAYAGIIALTWAYARSATRWAGVLVVLPAFVLLARLYQGAHHLTDVLTSVVYASLWLLVVTRLVLLPDRGQRGSSPRSRESARKGR